MWCEIGEPRQNSHQSDLRCGARFRKSAPGVGGLDTRGLEHGQSTRYGPLHVVGGGRYEDSEVRCCFVCVKIISVVVLGK